MAKKLLCVITLMLALVCVLASCGNGDKNSTHEHSYSEWIPTQAATCTADGTKTKYCSCGDKITETIQSTGHSYGEWIVTQAATCTADGTKTKYCSCGDKITETIQSTGHSYGEWIVTQAATCTANGTKAKQCSCGDKITETIQSTGHNWIEATCTEDKHCDKCYKSFTGTATGHIVQHGACVFCKMPGASIEWGHEEPKWVEYYYLYNDGGYDWKGGGYLCGDYGKDHAVFYRDGYLYFMLVAERSGNLIFDYQLKNSSGAVVKHGTISAGYVSKGSVYYFDYYLGKLNPGEYTFTVSSKNALG